MCSAGRGRLASQEIWESGLRARGWFFIKKQSIQSPGAWWVHPAWCAWWFPLCPTCFSQPDTSCSLCKGQSSPLSAAQMKWARWWLGLLLQLWLISNAVTSTRCWPCTALHQSVSSTAPLLLSLLLVSGYIYASKLERDRTWALTTGLQLSWWDTSQHTAWHGFGPWQLPLYAANAWAQFSSQQTQCTYRSNRLYGSTS